MSCSVEVAMRVMDLLFNTVRLGVGKPMILAVAFVMGVIYLDKSGGLETMFSRDSMRIMQIIL